MAPANFQLTIHLALLATSILLPHFASSASCTEADLTTAQSTLLAAIDASDPQKPSEASLSRCPALTNITETVSLVQSGLAQVEQAEICRDRVLKLRAVLNQKVTQIATLKTLPSLLRQMKKLPSEMTEATNDLYEDTVATVLNLLWINQVFSVRRSFKPKEQSSLDQLSPNYRFYLHMLQYLNRTNDEAIVGNVFDAILKRLNKLAEGIHRRVETGRHDLVTLLCWTVNNRLLDRKYEEKRSRILGLALQFYPKVGNTQGYEEDIKRRKICSENLPDTFIRGMALGWRDFK